MKRTLAPLLASLALLCLSSLCHADGLLQAGDTAHPITLFAASSTDGQTGITGATLTLTISKNGGAFAAPTGTVAEIGGGYYKYTPSAADDGVDGELVVNASAPGAYINSERRRVIAVNPDDPALLGLTGVATLPGQALQATSAAQTANGATLGAIKTQTDKIDTPADAAAFLSAPFLTIPADHTTSGVAETLTVKQVLAIGLAVPASDNVSTLPAAGSTATTSYYLAGQPAIPANLVYVGTVTYGATVQQSGRTVKIASPFPQF